LTDLNFFEQRRPKVTAQLSRSQEPRVGSPKESRNFVEKFRARFFADGRFRRIILRSRMIVRRRAFVVRRFFVVSLRCVVIGSCVARGLIVVRGLFVVWALFVVRALLVVWGLFVVMRLFVVRWFFVVNRFVALVKMPRWMSMVGMVGRRLEAVFVVVSLVVVVVVVTVVVAVVAVAVAVAVMMCRWSNNLSTILQNFFCATMMLRQNKLECMFHTFFQAMIIFVDMSKRLHVQLVPIGSSP
jgi:hypothetical protein